jgi:hypothetical protein
MLQGTLVASTEAGSTYVLLMSDIGVRWVRIPAVGSLRGATTGWQAHIPRVVPGERLLLDTLRSTPVVDVAFLPDALTSADADAATPQPETEPNTYANGIAH